MSVQVKQWSGGLTLECQVTLKLERAIGNTALEVNFTVTHEGKEIAQGWCFVPTGTELGTRTTDVRIAAMQNLWGDIALYVNDIKFDDRWLSVVVNNDDPLHPHDKPRAVRSF